MTGADGQMRALDPAELLDLAERGAGMGPARRALLTLCAYHPDADPDAIAAAALSARDRALLAARARQFGARMTAQDACGACGAQIELTLRAEDIGLGPRPGEAPFPPAPCGAWSDGADDIPLRAISAGDAAAAETAARAGDDAAAALLSRAAPGAARIPPDALDAALEALDPDAAVELSLACPVCAQTSLRAFDAAAFFWRELEARAPRILLDVADLARAFHWSERDILALPPARRAFYLAQARA